MLREAALLREQALRAGNDGQVFLDVTCPCVTQAAAQEADERPPKYRAHSLDTRHVQGA